MKRSVRCLVILWPWLIAAWASAQGEAPSGERPAQWRVVWTERPQSEATVLWSTAEPGERHRLLYDTTSHAEAADEYRWQAAADSGPYAGDEAELYWHRVRLTELAPDTVYWLRLESDDQDSRELHFRTAPASDRTVTLLSGGDSRSDPGARRAMNRRIAALAEDDAVLAFAHGGDYVYRGTSLALWSQWLSDYELTTTDGGRVLPIVPARGNHEAVGPLYDQVFGTPGGEGRNDYATRLSPAVLLVTLNTEVPAGGDQAAFLDDVLQHSEAHWKVVQYHRPIFPAVKRPSRVKPHWQPLFDRYGVDVALESDGHSLKRTVPVRGDEPDPDGVVYLGEGGLGVPQRTPDPDRWYLRPPGTAMSAHHVWALTFGAGTLTMEAIGADGRVLDHAVLER